jgi:gallate decarboxylase subunit D
MPTPTTYVTETGRNDLQAVVIEAGDDLVVVVTGGQAHLGGTATASPRPSLADPEKTSADLTSQALPGHKDDLLARQMAHRLAAQLGVRVMVAAGCHWDDLDRDGIEQAMANAAGLTGMILADRSAGRTDNS